MIKKGPLNPTYEGGVIQRLTHSSGAARMCAAPKIGVGIKRGTFSPHTELRAAQWLIVESQRAPICKQDKAQWPVSDRAGGRASLFKVLTWRQILLNDESAVYLTLRDKGRGVMFYPLAPPSGHYEDIQVVSKMLRRPTVPCCLVPASVPSSAFEWLLCIHPDRLGPYVNTSS